MKTFSHRHFAFTLLELLIVMGIIGILSIAVLKLLNPAQAVKRSRDAVKRRELEEVSAALASYIQDNGHGPTNFNPCCGAVEGDGYYEQSMQQLVSGGYLQKIPKSPDPVNKYKYYDYGPNNNIGALLITFLEASTPSTTGEPPSCRPFTANTNWCDQSSNQYYCLCNPY